MAAPPQAQQQPTPAPSPRLEQDDVLPPSLNTPTSARLTAALSLQQQLRDRLEQSAIELGARRKAEELVKERKQGGEGSRERRARMVEQVQRLRVEVENAKGKRAVRESVVEALDRSHLVSQHLHSLSNTSEEPTQQQSALQSLLTARDSLALQLLQAQNTFSSLSTERTNLRKRLLVLNRKNAALVAELRALQQPSEELLERLPSEVKAYYERLQAESLLLTSRLSIIRNVFQRLVAESGVQIFPPSSDLFRSSGSEADALAKLLQTAQGAAGGEEVDEEEEEEPMTDERLLRFLLLAGDGSGGGGGGGGTDEVGTEEGQRLPKELRGVMEKWRKEEEGRGEVERAKGKRNRTV